MRQWNWLGLWRRKQRAASGQIRTRRQEHRRWSGPVVAVELLEPRLVLAAPVANSWSGSIHMNLMLMSSVSVSDDDFDSLTVSLIGGTGRGSLMLSAGKSKGVRRL